MKFSVLDRDGQGLMTRNDFFSKLIEEPRHFFADAIFNLIEPSNEEVLTFGEFLEGVCLYCLFETQDVLRLCFAVFDTDRTGFISKDDIKHFIILLHDGDLRSNAKVGMERIENRKKGGGLLSFKDVCDLHRTFPSLLFPIFRLQIAFMRSTFSERWWNQKKVKLAESNRVRKLLEEAKAAAGEVDEEEVARQLMAQMVMDEMGTLKYYLMPWDRIRVQTKIEKRKEIEAQLEAKEAEGLLDEEEDINIQIK